MKLAHRGFQDQPTTKPTVIATHIGTRHTITSAAVSRTAGVPHNKKFTLPLASIPSSVLQNQSLKNCLKPTHCKEKLSKTT
jgi:hypothetical protein